MLRIGRNGRSIPYIAVPERKSTESTAKPEISITLSHTTIRADEWDKIELTLANTGTAPAFDITLTFPNDVDTRLLRPVDLAAGTSTTLVAGIKTKNKMEKYPWRLLSDTATLEARLTNRLHHSGFWWSREATWPRLARPSHYLSHVQ